MLRLFFFWRENTQNIFFLISSNIDVVILCMDYQQQQIEILRDKIQWFNGMYWIKFENTVSKQGNYEVKTVHAIRFINY